MIFHLVWSTKNRNKLITPQLQPKLYQYIGGILRDMQGILIEAGGMPDHIHLLVGLKPSHQPSKVVQNIKRGSSYWIHETQVNGEAFSWQEGYGIFTVSFTSEINFYLKFIKSELTFSLVLAKAPQRL